MMKRLMKKHSLFSLVAFFFFTPALTFAHSHFESSPQSPKMSLSLAAGYSHFESREGMMDLKAEFHFKASERIRLGFGVGYFADFGGTRRHMDRHHYQGGMVSWGMMGSRQNLRVVPLTLSLYYTLPISPKWQAFLVGGGGYYLGSLKIDGRQSPPSPLQMGLDVTTQDKHAFGPHAGFGMDFKVGEKVTIVGETIYRFVTLKGFQREFSIYYLQGIEKLSRFDIVLEKPSRFDIVLNGLSAKIGLKFSF